ncbi:YedE family putative selenium metabolism protein [Clostridium sporogenes]|uniref:YedE family putative selenium transporter n=1 Tax=Clostridium botulinum TaxID=1491 RepID=UPI000717B04B|nr:YedE family putative selenium transporter [Clostridium botulinum]KRU28927.1 YedE family putative selenium metabolism protein [Clostridium sporogenes]KRU32420.1 putative selenium metabolism protein, YedE family [Clostridium sporogenes]KRU34739.1 putative selenium metabolism protein, YedE family [Clostridium sporogenes]KRU45978.1 putative selenium metabolism protein, YedE family [Clostridium sporogenes]MBZ1329736.1 YedE-related selenium metabolism membrane protein [Clostridium botulinum]
MDSKKGIIFTGAVVGIISVLLVYLGNPVNMGFCIACFIRDIAGAVGLHRAPIVQYIRPEIIGMVMGAFIMALSKNEFDARGGSSPFIRFSLGFIVMVGALMFLGCPLRMILRLAGGDLNAIMGLVGFAVGIVIGIVFLNKGFSLKRNYKLNKSEGYLFPIVNVGLFILLVAAPAFIFFSKKGPGAAHAPITIALISGLIVGILAQRTRLCMVGGIRDLIMFKDSYLISGFISIFIFALIGNFIIGKFKLGFIGQPVAHTDALWNFLGMVLAGWGSVLLGGCPMRQLILSAEGNIDSVITVLGMLVGAAFCHNFSLASSAKGATANGKVSVMIGFILVCAISYVNIEKNTKVKMKGDVSVGSN